MKSSDAVMGVAVWPDGTFSAFWSVGPLTPIEVFNTLDAEGNPHAARIYLCSPSDGGELHVVAHPLGADAIEGRAVEVRLPDDINKRRERWLMNWFGRKRKK